MFKAFAKVKERRFVNQLYFIFGYFLSFFALAILMNLSFHLLIDL